MIRLEHKITTTGVGESLCNFTPRQGYLMIADRGYGNIKGIEHCSECGAEYIVRLQKNSFTVRDELHKKIDSAALFTKLNSEECADLSAFATNLDGGKVPERICARKKIPEATAQTQKKLKRRESKNQRVISEEAKVFNEYIVVATNLDKSVSAEDILETYRLRCKQKCILNA